MRKLLKIHEKCWNETYYEWFVREWGFGLAFILSIALNILFFGFVLSIEEVDKDKAQGLGFGMVVIWFLTFASIWALLDYVGTLVYNKRNRKS